MLVQRRVFLSGSKRLKRAATVVLRVGTKNMSATADVYVYNSVYRLGVGCRVASHRWVDDAVATAQYRSGSGAQLYQRQSPCGVGLRQISIYPAENGSSVQVLVVPHHQGMFAPSECAATRLDSQVMHVAGGVALVSGMLAVQPSGECSCGVACQSINQPAQWAMSGTHW